MSIKRWFHTVRHLRPAQVYGRLWYRALRPRPDLRAALAPRGSTGAWTAGCARAPSLLAEDTFRFLSVSGRLPAEGGWNDLVRPRLWRYNLHYFDDLNAESAERRSAWHGALIARWIRENPPATGTGWEPYPTSLRIVNWIRWSDACRRRGAPGLDAEALHSLTVQARWLRSRLERHLLGNHLWANAKALVFAGTFFEGDEADAWLRDGLTLAKNELDAQVLEDGGHFERSPMYHAVVLEDVLDLVGLSRAFRGRIPETLVVRWYGVATRMLRWMQLMTHPDGQIALFNDAAYGIAPGLAALREYARRLDVAVPDDSTSPIEVMGASGYVRLQNDRAVLICDVAPVGPDHLPAHAHADTLSFELSLDGTRVFVNGGTSTYEPGVRRDRERSTRSHNTVVVDGQDSSEVWSAFRVARRARPFDVRWGTADGAVWLCGAHDGYRRLAGRVTHRRRWALASGSLFIEDQLDGRFAGASAYLHLHPTVCAERRTAGGGWALRTVGGSEELASVETSGRPAEEHEAWHPGFGLNVANTALVSTFEEPTLMTRIRWR